jgi:ABC-type proline/glycine betaine transport system permease subunit
VALATLAVFANAGGLGTEIYPGIGFKTGVATAGLIAIAMAFSFDAALIAVQRLLTPWRAEGARA